MENSGLIFLPDISGFTKFITETEIRHSHHIIKELIEVILESNKLKLNISEIEGDAVLFYKLGSPPSFDLLLNQVKSMFLNFHSYLKVIERDRVCQCGACSTASNLTLKFIAHFGEIQEISIKNFNKIMSSDVILAHRLLKTQISKAEYFLSTDSYLKLSNQNLNPDENWVKPKEYFEEFENFGKVKTEYIGLSELLKNIPETPSIPIKRDPVGPPNINIDIKAPILLVHDALTDHSKKLQYVPGIKELRGGERINRLSSTHTCVFDDLEIHIVTTGGRYKRDEIIYSEKTDAGFGFSITSDYKLINKDGITQLSLTLIPEKPESESFGLLKKVFSSMKRKLILKKLISSYRKNLNIFKEFCEKSHQQNAIQNT
ncbi:DUF2652 domain-containing protein [Bacteroidota bacterium]